MLSSMLLSVAFVPAQIWTVDDDGPADFASIADAIPQVLPGDVLAVQPGTYRSFHLDKSLSILGPAGASRPVVDGESTVSGADACSFVRLKMSGLSLSSVPGRVTIDDCEIGTAYDSSLRLEQCSQVLVTRTTVEGPNPTVSAIPPALRKVLPIARCT